MLSKAGLFRRLAEGHAAGVTVVTPNRRLAQALQLQFDDHQAGSNLAAWEAPDILPFGAFVERLWEDALYCPMREAGGGAVLPLLLTPAQEQRLWEEILAGSGLLAVPQAAAQCRAAWRLVHLWRIAAGPGNEDAAAFSRWSRQYRARTEGQVDAARLPDLVSSLLEKIATPKRLVAYGFDILPPQTRDLLAKLDYLECRPEPMNSVSHRARFTSPKLEIETAAKWARARVEEGRARIGVVVPQLVQRRNEIMRVFLRALGPGDVLPGAPRAVRPFNISLGEPLIALPLVRAALDLVEFSSRPIDFARVSRLIRSPFIAGAETEMAARARLDAKLRRNFEATVSLARLIGAVEVCPILRRHLEQVLKLSREGGKEKSFGEWARHFSAVLEAGGFPGERALDSAEFQTRAKWHETLGEFARLERISDDSAFQVAFSCLQRLCAGTLFQPESVQAPIQVLGVLESAGLRFDCLWVSGLTDEAWPLPAKPNPFIPIALQKQAGIPEASAEASLELDRRLTAQWLGAADEVIFSYSAKEADRDLAPSPLILHVPEATVALADSAHYRDMIFQSRKLEHLEDAHGPAVAPGKVRGGTRVLADQAACPFRAFARWRLAAEALETPPDGPDARERGKLLHALMKEIWSQLKGSASLQGDLEPVIRRAAEAAVRTLGLEGRFAALEKIRLGKLAREWLELEKTRAPFEVACLEDQRTLSLAGLELSGRIDRLDLLLEGAIKGAYALIDYKTGNHVTPKVWETPRPDDPQLALYAVNAREDIAAVAFAALRPGAMRFMGFAREERAMPNVRRALDWPALLAAWKAEAESLGKAFASGEAQVDPKNDLQTCRLCDLQTLCRVHEKIR